MFNWHPRCTCIYGTPCVVAINVKIESCPIRENISHFKQLIFLYYENNSKFFLEGVQNKLYTITICSQPTTQWDTRTFYLFEMQRHSQQVPIYWFTPSKFSTARIGSWLKTRAMNSTRSPTQVVENQVLNHHHCLTGFSLARSWSHEPEPTVKLRSSYIRYQHAKLLPQVKHSWPLYIALCCALWQEFTRSLAY